MSYYSILLELIKTYYKDVVAYSDQTQSYV